MHYLLGYLYDQEDRPADAVGEFRKAVELDPEYLNAWLRLSGEPASELSAEERNSVASNLIRLDPSGQHRLDLSAVTDLASIWK